MTRIDRAAALAPRYDLVVIGAGPAGQSAAIAAAGLGIAVLVVDEQAAPGGQIHRGITTTPVRDRAVLGADYWRGLPLAQRFLASGGDYAAGAKLFSLLPAGDEPGRYAEIELGLSIAGQARPVFAREVILATGALERPFPIPGWTLPGVLTAGAAQIALKAHGLVPAGRVVLAGSGPLLLLVASQLRAAGADITAVLDTTPAANRPAAARFALGFLRSPYLAKGLRLLATARGGPRRIAGVTALRAEGGERLRGVAFRAGGGEQRLDCDLLLLHQGVVPNTAISNAIGCAHEWDPWQLCWVPRLDPWLCSTVPGVAIAGDGGGIAGAECAAESGTLAALGAAHRLGRLDAAERDRRAAPVRQALGRLGRGRRFLDALYRPADGFRVPPEAATVVCRCEEVTAGQIREAVAGGATGPNQLKAFLRCGMGPCQGRLCALTVTELVAAERRLPPAEIGTYRARPPFKPVTMGELAALPQTNAAVKAVVRS
jgi:NADPH-dependent 2,4-dienoyl-CoA reductase/sulfur reductase-like enzyme